MIGTVWETGAYRAEASVDPGAWLAALSHLPTGRPGVRINGVAGLATLLSSGTKVHALVEALLGPRAMPVRAILFDKSERNNWPLGWHQDRTIPVKSRHDVDGFGPWTVKNGVTHVEPPFAILGRMVTLRIHLDAVDEANAPLRIAPGSHRLGRISEQAYDSVVAQCGEAICLADPGDVWLYATPILHASSSASRPSRRRVVQIDFSADTLPPPLQWAGI